MIALGGSRTLSPGRGLVDGASRRMVRWLLCWKVKNQDRAEDQSDIINRFHDKLQTRF